MKKRNVGIIELFICTIIWGCAFVFQSIAGSYINAILINTIRFFLGGSFLFIIISIRYIKTKTYSIDRKTFGFGAFIGVVLFIASNVQQIGINNTSTAKAGFLTAMYIILVPVLSFFIYKKKLSLIQLFGVVCSVIGVGFLSLNGDFSINLGDGLCLVSALFFSIHIILCAKATLNHDTLSLAMISFFICSLLGLLVSFFFDYPSWYELEMALPSLLFLGVLSSGVGYTLQMLGQKSVEEVPASLIMSLESVFCAIFGFIILNQSLELKEIIGSSIMLFSVLIVQLFPSKKKMD